jgi:hypothetical protein
MPFRYRHHPRLHDLQASERERGELFGGPGLESQAGPVHRVDAVRRRAGIVEVGGRVRGGQVTPRCESRQQGGHDLRGLFVVWEEVQHRHQHQRDRLSEIECFAHPRMAQDRPRVVQIRLDVGGPAGRMAGQQRASVR